MSRVVRWSDIWGRKHTMADHTDGPYGGTAAVDPMGHGFAFGVDPAVAGNLQTIGAANRCTFVRLRNGAAAITKVGFLVGTVSGNVAVAAYSNSGTGRSAVPGARLAGSASVACPAAGYAEVALGSSVAVNPGDWLALACDSGTATFAAALGQNVTNLVAGMVAYQDAGAFPCPTAPAIVGYGTRSLALVGVP